MRILLSGMTSVESKPPHERRGGVQKIDVLTFVWQTLQSLGHEVDWRRVHVGEDLSSYDLMFLSWGGVLSLNAKPNALGVLYAASHETPQIIYWTDWQFRAQLSHMRTLSRKPHYLSKPGLSGAEFYYDSDPQDQIATHADALLQTCVEITSPWSRSNRLAVCPMYPWGDHAKVLKDIPCGRERITYLDPSPFILTRAREALSDPLSGSREQRAWTLPSLMPHGEWVERQGITWPVVYFGSRKMKAERLRTEDDVVRQIASRGGLLSPRYHHSGSGWWRSRFIYGAVAGTAVAGDPEEGTSLGEAYKLTPADVEIRNDNNPTGLELQQIASAQREALLPRLWTPEQWTEGVRALPGYVGL